MRFWFRQLGLLTVLCLLGASSALAQTRYSDAELDQLVGPIALYPDVLIAEILPACTYPDQVMAASRYVTAHPGSSAVDSQPWDSSVKAVARYPEVINQMAAHGDWVNALGWAFVNQPQDLMESVQELRARAKANGTLKSSDQLTVSQEGQTIIITPPMRSQVVYVPQYDTATVYASPTPGWVAPVLSFGAGLAMGSWLSHGCDWWGHGVCTGWYYPGAGWRPGGVNAWGTTINVNNYHPQRWTRNTTINAPTYTNVNNNIRVGNTNIKSGNTNIRGGNTVQAGNTNVRGGNSHAPQQPVRPNVESAAHNTPRGQGSTLNQASVPNLENRPNLDAYRGGNKPNLPSGTPTGSKGGALDGVERGSQVRRDSAQGHSSRASANSMSSSRPSGAHSSGGGGRRR